MTGSELDAYLATNAEYTYTVVTSEMGYYVTTISGRSYAFSSSFNDYGQLYMVSFHSSDNYDWTLYDEVKENAGELYALLEEKYGDPIFDEWPDWSVIPENGEKVACLFGGEPVGAAIFVENDFDGTFYIKLSIEDLNLEPVDNSESNSDDYDDWED